MFETKLITSLYVITDSDNHNDKIGDIDGGLFPENFLENHIKKYGADGLLLKLSSMISEVIVARNNVLRENNKTDACVLNDFYYLDLSDEGYWLIKTKSGERYSAGYDKQKVLSLINRLNQAHRPNIIQKELNKIWVCWNYHDKDDDCEYINEI